MSMDCVLFDFATKNLHLATIFCHLVDKCDLRILLISSPDLVSNYGQVHFCHHPGLILYCKHVVAPIITSKVILFGVYFFKN